MEATMKFIRRVSLIITTIDKEHKSVLLSTRDHNLGMTYHGVHEFPVYGECSDISVQEIPLMSLLRALGNPDYESFMRHARPVPHLLQLDTVHVCEEETGATDEISYFTVNISSKLLARLPDHLMLRSVLVSKNDISWIETTEKSMMHLGAKMAGTNVITMFPHEKAMLIKVLSLPA